MKKLTEKQKALLDFISAYQAENKKIPTMEIMSKAMGYSISNVQHKLYNLMRKKMIFRENMYKILAATDAGAPREDSATEADERSDGAPLQ